MASAQRANVVLSSSLSASELSYSMLSSVTTITSSLGDILDDTSSDGDQVVFDRTEISDDEDFVLIPHSRTPQQEAASIEYAMFRLNITTPEPLITEPAAPITPTTPSFHTSRTKDCKVITPLDARGRRSAGARSKGEGKLKLASNAPIATPPENKSNGRDRRRRAKKDVAPSYPSPATSPERELTEEALFFANYKKGYPLVVESDAESEYAMMKYEDAKSFITSFLSNPSIALAASAYTRLTFLQSLIIELGLMSPTSDPPTSMNAAKRIIKSRAFVNIGDYLYAREKGPIELENIKFKSKKALTNDLKKNKGRRQTDRRWAKRHGLNVLLVSVL